MKEIFAMIFNMNISEVTMAFIIAQTIGLAATVISIVSAQLKKIYWILFFEFVANMLVTLNYVLLGGMSGGYVCLVASVQTAVSCIYIYRKISVPKGVTAVFFGLYILVSVYTYSTPVDILACLCAITFALSIVQTKSSAYRIFIGINSLLWILYDIIVLAYTMIITHGLLLISVIIAILRHDIKKNKPLAEE